MYPPAKSSPPPRNVGAATAPAAEGEAAAVTEEVAAVEVVPVVLSSLQCRVVETSQQALLFQIP